ncbi:hypothetical protein F5B22DRAFT_470573 [Xylaria bambusicola]|uniref:uncharacterized protein n=1 Tax=Xylaria bambusicola TaxID=326684 RepID=UPI002008CDF2|nr:uncharacterized protein F5B22DRAFT_470573 [Xylaria bambusicola]KAI0522314.1 hypothetical protein F5B22DRAFT_470573 [Xylaria bambusicola]
MHTTKSSAFSVLATLVATVLSSPVVQLRHYGQQRSVCTKETATKRMEWSSLSTDERKQYISAVECLMAKDSRYPAGELPASDNYYSDFAAHHAGVALHVHMSGSFLSFHREFIQLMEDSLHGCGYPSDMGLPYWDWTAYLDAPLNQSTLFDGSPSSLGGDGESMRRQGSYVISAAEAPMVSPVLEKGNMIPPGSGGGCVVEGPFANTTLYLGPFPVELTLTGLPDDWTEKNPHCFTRNLNDAVLRLLNNANRIKSLVAAPNITDFQYQLNAIHRGGHVTVGGPMMDFFVSPLDPAFFLHHAQIDRLWTMWQAHDPTSRRYAYNGTNTYMSLPDTPEVTNSTTLDFGVLGGKVTLEEIADPMAGRYCYQYV